MPTPTTLPELARALRGLLRVDLPSRPFISDGSPFNCDVAIVGINPGSATSFWEFWSDDVGFKRAAWVQAYYARPGASRNATRNRIERLVPALLPFRVVELNAYPYVTRTEAQIAAEMKDPRVLDLMLKVARPRAIFIFGKEPARMVAPLLGVAVPDPASVTLCSHEERKVFVFTEPHLSRGWSYDAVEAFAAKVKLALQGAA
jgi:hypothetical protein